MKKGYQIYKEYIKKHQNHPSVQYQGNVRFEKIGEVHKNFDDAESKLLSLPDSDFVFTIMPVYSKTEI